MSKLEISYTITKLPSFTETDPYGLYCTVADCDGSEQLLPETELKALGVPIVVGSVFYATVYIPDIYNYK